jgi:hypothetical protein
LDTTFSSKWKTTPFSACYNQTAMPTVVIIRKSLDSILYTWGGPKLPCWRCSWTHDFCSVRLVTYPTKVWCTIKDVLTNKYGTFIKKMFMYGWNQHDCAVTCDCLKGQNLSTCWYVDLQTGSRKALKKGMNCSVHIPFTSFGFVFQNGSTGHLCSATTELPSTWLISSGMWHCVYCVKTVMSILEEPTYYLSDGSSRPAKTWIA